MSWRAKRVGTAECVMNFDEVPCKGRPRMDTRTGRVYTPPKTKSFEDSIRAQWLDAVGQTWRSHKTEVHVFIEVQRPLARSNPRRWAGRADLMKPDADNVAKVICDSLNGLAYKDDSQITQLAVTYDARPPYSDTVHVRVRVDYYSEEEI